MSYLLDSNTWISLLRWQNAGVLAQLQQHPADEILLCSVVLAELWFGAERSDPTRRSDNFKLVDELAAKYESLPFDNSAARDYAAIRAHLFSTGQVKREFNVNTERADQRKYQIKFNLMYDSSVPAHECDQEEFVVVPD